jgi:dipeptidyl aminopeptidase/acylaminoacyl peptidase
MMTYLALKSGAPVNAAVSGAGVADLPRNMALRPGMGEVFRTLMHAEGEALESMLAARSAVHWPEKIRTPLMLVHGDHDDRVSVQDSRDLHALLVAQGTPTEYTEYPGGDHFLIPERSRIIEQAVRWFTRYKR